MPFFGNFTLLGGWVTFDYNGLRGGSFADIPGGMVTQQKSLDVIPQSPPKMAKIGENQEFSSPRPQTTKLRLCGRCS